MKFNPLKMSNCVSAIALSVGMIIPAAAVAQTDTAGDTATAEDDVAVQDTIYVTARKRQETQLEIPVSVSALSQDAIDERGITDAADLSNFIPGFDFEEVGTGGASGRANPQIRFRGVGVQIGSARPCSIGRPCAYGSHQGTTNCLFWKKHFRWCSQFHSSRPLR